MAGRKKQPSSRQVRRGKAAQTKRAVKQAAKQAGLLEPSAADLDPRTLALRLTGLEAAFEKMAKAQAFNSQGIGHAFQMNDVHLHVLKRLVVELSQAAGKEIAFEKYYAEYFEAAKAAGEAGDYVGPLWASGMSTEEAIQAAIAKKAAEDKRRAKDADETEEASSATVEVAQSIDEAPEERVFGGDYEAQA